MQCMDPILVAYALRPDSIVQYYIVLFWRPCAPAYAPWDYTCDTSLACWTMHKACWTTTCVDTTCLMYSI